MLHFTLTYKAPFVIMRLVSQKRGDRKMKYLKFGIIAVLAAMCFCLLFPVRSHAAAQAQDITKSTEITGIGYSDFSFLQNGSVDDYRTSGENAQITLKNSNGMAQLYLLFDMEYGAYTVTDDTTNQSFTAGTDGFLHEHIDLVAAFGEKPVSVTLRFDAGPVQLSEISVFSEGMLPDTVQVWQKPLDGKADLVLFSTHGDDEHLYFAGLLPQYAGEKQYGVQVVYMTDHRNDTNKRTHEMLNGLWNTGVRAYPVFGSFPDFRIDSLSGTYERYENQYGITKDQLLSFVVEQIRRFRPIVAVGHDLAGEYGHGMHQVYADLLTNAVHIAKDGQQFPESAQQYGTWEIPKLYLHLYEENAIVLDYDQPLTAFNGLSAFQVSQQRGFPSHKTQQWPMFVTWIYGEDGQIDKATQIDTYNPAHFGLYYSAVGTDQQKNDFFENVLTYEQQEQERLEQERLEQERLEQERIEQERLEQERLEQERLEQERIEQERLEQERLETLERTRRQRILYGALGTGIFLAGIIVLILFIVKKHKER